MCKAQGALCVLARHKNAHQPLAGDNGANAHAAALQRGNDLFLVCAVRQRAPDGRDGRKRTFAAFLLRYARDRRLLPRLADEAARAFFPARSDGDGYGTLLCERHAALMQHLRALLREQQHIVIRNAFPAQRIGAEARVGGIDPVHIGIDDELIGVKRRGERHGARIRAAAPERCDIALLIKALKARHDHDASLFELAPDALRADILDLCIAMHAVRAHGHLPCIERDRVRPQLFECQRPKRRAHLLARGKQRVQFAPIGRTHQLMRFFEKRIRCVPLRREDDDHVAALIPAFLCDMCHAQQTFRVAHRAAAEFLHDQAHLHHFQQKNGSAGRPCGNCQSIV